MTHGRRGEKPENATVRRLLVEAIMRLTPEARGAGIEPGHLVSRRVIEKAAEAGGEALDPVLGEIAEAARLIHGLVTGEVKGHRVLDSLRRLARILGKDDYEVVADLLARKARGLGAIVADAPPSFRVEPGTVLVAESTGASIRLGYRMPEGGILVYVTPAKADRFTASFYIPEGEGGQLGGAMVFDLRDGVSRLLVVPTPSRGRGGVRVYYGAPESRLALPRIRDYVKASLGLASLLAESRAYWLDGSKLYVARSVAFAVEFPSRFSHGPAKPAPASRLLAGAAGRGPEHAILGVTEEGEPVVGLPGLGYVSLPFLPEEEAGGVRIVEHFTVGLPLASQPEALAEAAKPLKGAVSVGQDGVLEVAGFEGDDLALYMSGRIGRQPGSSYTGDLHDFAVEAAASWRAFKAVLMGFDSSHVYVAGEAVLRAGGGFESLVGRAREGALDACTRGKTLAEGRGPIRGVSAPIEGVLRIELADGGAVQLANVKASDHLWLAPRLGYPSRVSVVQRRGSVYICMEGDGGSAALLAARVQG